MKASIIILALAVALGIHPAFAQIGTRSCKIAERAEAAALLEARGLVAKFQYLKICDEVGHPTEQFGISSPVFAPKGVCQFAESALDQSYAIEAGVFVARAGAECPAPTSSTYIRAYHLQPAQFIELTDLVTDAISTAQGRAPANVGTAEGIRRTDGFQDFSEAVEHQKPMGIEYNAYLGRGPLNLYDIYQIGVGEASIDGNFEIEIRKYIFAKPIISHFYFAIP